MTIRTILDQMRGLDQQIMPKEWQLAMKRLKAELNTKDTLSLQKEVPGYDPLDLCLLMEALKDNQSIKTLDVSCQSSDESYITEENISVLTQCLPSTAILHLNFTNNGIEDKGAALLLETLKEPSCPQIHSLNLSNTGISDAIFDKLGEILNHKPIQRLDFSHNVGITDKGFHTLYEKIGNPPTHFIVDNTCVSEKMHSYLEQLKNLSLLNNFSYKEIMLSKSPTLSLDSYFKKYTWAHFSLFLDALQENSSIKILDFSYKKGGRLLTALEIDTLIQYLSTNDTITDLDLRGQNLSDEQGDRLFLALQYNFNKKLHTIDLSKTQIGNKTLQSLANCFARNPKAFKHIDLSYTPLNCLRLDGILTAICGMTLKYQRLDPDFLNLKGTQNYEAAFPTLEKLYTNFRRHQADEGLWKEGYALFEYTRGETSGIDILDLKPIPKEEMPLTGQEPPKTAQEGLSKPSNMTDINQVKPILLEKQVSAPENYKVPTFSMVALRRTLSM